MIGGRRFLMVYPQFQPTMWGLQYTLPLIGKKSLLPPLGLTPPEYEIRLVDMNVRPLSDEDLDWADAVLFSAMLPQREALFAAAARARARGKYIVFGGPFPTSCADDCRPQADTLVINEAELTWSRFLADWAAGRPQPTYASEEKADMTKSPAPRFDLVDMAAYTSVPLQFSRGCPFQCEFCDIIVMLGRVPRLKGVAQFLAELQSVYDRGYRGQVSVVDDNLIGNGRETRRLLAALRDWNESHGNPFHYFCEASTNLADDPALLKALVDARFTLVFVGIETPSLESLKETKKFQNTRGSLLDRVKTLQAAGLHVMGGFIVGFDNDGPDIFEKQKAFIEAAAIPNVYISPLVALPGTPLFERMGRAGRLIPGEETSHTFISGYTNIRLPWPMGPFFDNHREMLATVYDPAAYFRRSLESLRRLPRSRNPWRRWKIFRSEMRVFFSVVPAVRAARLQRRPWAAWGGIFQSARRFFGGLDPAFRRAAGRFIFQVAFARPERLPWVFHFVCMGYHFDRMTREKLLPDLDRRRAALDVAA
jgi:radical SAM superfamily enzyme YgiQ (UPF0313 family)